MRKQRPALVTPQPLAPLPLHDVSAAAGIAVQRGADRSWSLADLDWTTLRPDDLTDNDRSVVRYITFIEDHIPGYLMALLNSFPIEDPDLDLAEVCVNREYFRFLIAWAYDEERHSSALTQYQLRAGIATADDLPRELATESRKPFRNPYQHPLQTFAYTLIQEKATQLFYQRFRDVATEPLLRDLLQRLARDEARHFALYSDLVGAYLRRDGTRAVPHLKEVLETFRMPLADSLTNYWRWSLKVADTVGYDHTDAYEALVRLVQDCLDQPGQLGADELMTFVAAVRRLP
jgi:hypothetical protein